MQHLDQLVESIPNPTMQPSTVHLNLTRREKWGLRWFKSHPELMTVEADKNLGICIIEKSEYVERVKSELNRVPDSFRPLPFSLDKLHERRRNRFNDIARILGYLRRDIGGRKIRDFIMEGSTEPFKVCNLHGLPKLHKPGSRMRLIYPFRAHPLGQLHKFIAKSLEPFVLRFGSVISNVLEIVIAVSGRTFDSGTTIVSADITAMYPNIDRKIALKIAQRTLDCEEGQCFNSHNDWNWRQLLELAHEDMEFMFDNELFEQTKGVPIGSPAGPQIAILALHHQIHRKWASLVKYLHFGGIYFDDLFCIFKSGVSIDRIRDMINDLLSETSLTFDPDSFSALTIDEMASGVSFDILDISIISSRAKDCSGFQLNVKVYCKKMGAYQYVPWSSAHPPATKRGIIRGELLRRLRLTDCHGDWLETLQDLKGKLVKRGYPLRIIEEQVTKVDFGSRIDQRLKIYKKVIDRRTNSRFPFNNLLVNPSSSPSIPLKMMYDPRMLRILKKRRKLLQEHINDALKAHNAPISNVRVITAFNVGRNLTSALRN